METLKDFVQANLGNSDKTKFVFESGRTSTALAMGQIVQMALELKHLS